MNSLPRRTGNFRHVTAKEPSRTGIVQTCGRKRPLPFESGHFADAKKRPLSADFVAEVGSFGRLGLWTRTLIIRRSTSGGIDRQELTADTDHAGHGSAVGGGRATSFARRRRFCAIAPSVNSSCAPRGPRNLSRPSRRMRLRCANSRLSSREHPVDLRQLRAARDRRSDRRRRHEPAMRSSAMMPTAFDGLPPSPPFMTARISRRVSFIQKA